MAQVADRSCAAQEMGRWKEILYLWESALGEDARERTWSASTILVALLVRQQFGKVGLHQQTGLSASTVPNDDELPSNLRHDG